MFHHLLSRKHVTKIRLILYDKLEKFFDKNCLVCCYSRHMCPMTGHIFHLIHGNQYSQYPKKGKKQSKSPKQVERAQNIQQLKGQKREEKLKSLKKKKRKDVPKKKLIDTPCDNNIKTLIVPSKSVHCACL